MNDQRYTKLHEGDVGYLTSTKRQGEGRAGIVIQVKPDIGGSPPHIRLKFPDGTESGLLDYKEVGYGGPPPRKFHGGLATVKWVRNGDTGDPPPASEEHREWVIEQVSEHYLEEYGWKTGLHWVLVRDEWEHRLHWLTYAKEYSFVTGANRDGVSQIVILEGIPPEGTTT